MHRVTEGTQIMLPSHSALLQVGILRLIRRLLITLICIVMLMLIYHCCFYPRKVSYKVGKVDKTREDFRNKETQDFLIDTPGCYIPNYAKTYKYDFIKKEPRKKNMCGVRYVFIDTIENNKIKFRIYKYNQGEVRCCYRFAKEITIPGHEHNLLSNRFEFGEKKRSEHMVKHNNVVVCHAWAESHSVLVRAIDGRDLNIWLWFRPWDGPRGKEKQYTPCKIFTNNTIVWLEQEVITVTCTNLPLPPRQSGESKTDIIYKDSYIILKKKDDSNSQSETNDKSMQWNVLMIGLEGMSRTRLFDTMPHTTKYLKKHKWLDFKAYQKVGDNTFQNLMSILTGKRMPTIYSNCTSDLEKCADFFIWKKYKHNGYKTAHGESNLLSDTFCSGFKKSPTDHYMQLLLRAITSNAEDILCIGKKPSASHLLNYANKFSDSYKANPFFGVFWINTYISYNDIPQLSDTQIVKFFRKVKGVLNNTFVIFFSDQGISFGAKRYSVESYYDNQLPMLFVWTPLLFRSHYTNKNYNLHVNQERLITPYDVYVTLGDILKLSMNSSEEIRSEACPQCTSLFNKLSPNRTCADAGVGETWCSCHDMLPVTNDDKRLENSTWAAVAHIKNIRNSIKTVPCTSCAKLKYPTIFRAHEYYEGEKTYHVIGFHLSPNKLKFEAVVVHYEGRLDVLTVRSLARYNDRGNCAVHSQDRPFCVCAFNTSCIPENKSIINFSNLSLINLADFMLFH